MVKPSPAGPDPCVDGGSGPMRHFNLGCILTAWVGLGGAANIRGALILTCSRIFATGCMKFCSLGDTNQVQLSSFLLSFHILHFCAFFIALLFTCNNN